MEGETLGELIADVQLAQGRAKYGPPGSSIQHMGPIPCGVCLLYPLNLGPNSMWGKVAGEQVLVQHCSIKFAFR